MGMSRFARHDNCEDKLTVQNSAKITVADIDENGAANTVEEIVKEGGYVIYLALGIYYAYILNVGRKREAFSIKCNIVEWDDQVAAYEATLAKFGSIDVVVRRTTLR